LTQFGDGLQRIFHIALLFAYAENGIVLVDELENAIHTTLLSDFTRLLQDLAVEFNVQLFLTSHSKECLDAFIRNRYHLEDVSACSLARRPEGVVSFHRTGEQMDELLDLGDVDIRRSR
jgi:AAA15 family ATPase/GTPase